MWHSVFGTEAAAHHVRHVTRRARKHVRKTSAPAPVLAVPMGSVAAHALSMPDQPYPLQEWDGTPDALHAQATAATPSWLAVLVDDTTLQDACRQGDVQILAVAPDRATVPAAASPCGLPGGETSLVLAWDHSRLGETPPEWPDFWDVARHPGKRALRLDPRTTLEIALLADGVPISNVYNVLSTSSGVDRAFRKLDQLRPYIVWWRNTDDVARIMSTGAALMVATPHDALVNASSQTSGFVPQWHGSLRQRLSWAIPHNVPAATAGHVVDMLREQAPRHDDLQDAGMPDHDGQSLDISDRFWAANLALLQKRFMAWLTTSP